MRIALWNGSGLDNHGDRLLDHVNRIELLKRIPSAEFETFCPWSAGSDCEDLWVDTNGRWCGEGFFDAIVIGGGALLMGPPFSHPGMQSFFLGPYPGRFRDDCFVSWNAVCAGSQFAAPLGESWKEYVRAAASRIDFVTVRNPRTSDFLVQCDVAEAPTVVPDPVVLIRQPRAQPARTARRPRIGLAVARSVFPKEFLQIMGDSAAAGLAAANPAVVRFPATLNPESYDDLHYAQQFGTLVRALLRAYEVEIAIIPNVYGDERPAEVLASVLGGSCRAVSVSKNSMHLLGWIESLDCLVASRLHYCVLALAVGTPVVALDPYYSSVLNTSKLGEFMAVGQGLDCWMPLTQALDGQTRLSDLVPRALSLQDRLGDAHTRLWDAAAAHFDQLAARISSGGQHRE